MSTIEDAKPSGGARRIFRGADGLRAGWSLLLFFALMAGTLMALTLLFRSTKFASGLAPALGGALTPELVAVAYGLQAAILLFVTFTMSLIERRPFSRYGLKGRHLARDLFAGAVSGFVLLSLLVGALWASHALVFTPTTLAPAPALTYGLEWLGTFALVGFVEEYWFRGYLQFTFARGIAGMLRRRMPQDARAIGFWTAAFVFSVVFFALAHKGNSNETLIGILSVGGIGLVFVYSLWRTGALWWAIGFHGAWDWSQSFFYGTADSGNVTVGHLFSVAPVGPILLSGGGAGPEGSILILPTLLIAALVVRTTLPDRTTAEEEQYGV